MKKLWRHIVRETKWYAWYRAGGREERRRVLAIIQLVANQPPQGETPAVMNQHFFTCQQIATLVGEP